MSIKSSDGTAALDKALDVLDAVGRSRQGLSQAELAQLLSLPRTTLYRLLGTLVKRGLLRRDPQRRVYCLGFRCFEYARAAYAMPDLVAAAGAELRALRDMSGETTYLFTLDGHEAVLLERCDGAHARRAQTDVGARRPLHCSGQGKAMLAALPPERRDALLRELHLEAYTPHTITDRRRLQAELRLIAQRGWSIDDEEILPGVRCCGAAIVDERGELRGGLSIAGPAFRLTMERLELLGPEVAEAARRVGAQLAAATPAHGDEVVSLVAGDWAFEGALPVWTHGRLFWADLLAPAVHMASATSDGVLLPVDEPIRALLPYKHGVAVRSGTAWLGVAADGTPFEAEGLPQRACTALCGGPGGLAWGCVADGDRWLVGELAGDELVGGGLRLAEPATALAWDAELTTLYVAAAGSGTLWSAAGGRGTLRRLATVPKGSGRLSGLAPDRRGGLWTALRGGWSVAHFAADGSMERVVALAVPNPSGVALADDGTLFVTSARHGLAREALDAAPLSGRLFTVATA